MKEYESIIEEKRFNLSFYNEQKLEELKKEIINLLLIHKMRCPYLSEVEDMYAPLMKRIEDGESIQDYEYEKCYMDLYIGPFKAYYFLILCLAGGVALIIRWCLNYIGLL